MEINCIIVPIEYYRPDLQDLLVFEIEASIVLSTTMLNDLPLKKICEREIVRQNNYIRHLLQAQQDLVI